MRSLHLLTTRAPTRCHWGTSTPKGMGGNPEGPGRMWGGVRGEEKWRRDGTGAPEGWLGGGEGFPHLERPTNCEGINRNGERPSGVQRIRGECG